MIYRLVISTCLLASAALISFSASAASVNDEVALQMYTLRNVGSAEKQFAMAHEAGFKHIEIVGTHDLSAKQLASLLKK